LGRHGRREPMSDYIPNPMNDPNDPRRYDKYGNSRFEPVDEAGRGPYILLGILVAIGLIGGLLYFNNPPKDQSVAEATATPTTMERPAMPSTARGGAVPAPAPSSMPQATKPMATPEQK